MKTNLNIYLSSLLFLLLCFFFSCKSSITGGMSSVRDDCPYQRLNFTGFSTVNLEKGIEILDSLSAALILEKNSFMENGNLTNNLRVKVANMTKEVANYKVPISEVDASEYVQISNSICTLRKDLYENKNFTSMESRKLAEEQYINLLNAIDNLKKKLK